MNTSTEKTLDGAPTAEDYAQAMNFIGQSLYASLVQSVEKLPAHFRSQKMVCNALSAFLVNVVYKQSSGNYESCQKMIDEINMIIKNQLENLPRTKS